MRKAVLIILAGIGINVVSAILFPIFPPYLSEPQGKPQIHPLYQSNNVWVDIVAKNDHYIIKSIDAHPLSYLRIEGRASWYGPRFHGKKMANGAQFDRNGYTIATNLSRKILPLNSEVIVMNPQNKKRKSLKVKVTDTGPWDCKIVNNKLKPVYSNGSLIPHPERQFDLSERIAEELGFKKEGHTEIVVIIPLAPKQMRWLVKIIKKGELFHNGDQLAFQK